MQSFNVINYDCNRKKFIAYDVIPYLIEAYKDYKKNNYKKAPETFEEFKKFIKDESMYHFWSRCEYEIILMDWPNQQHEEKWDVYQQIMMNLDIITKIIIDECK